MPNFNDKRSSISDYQNIANQCRKFEVPMVSFTGGEPMVDVRLAEIIEKFDTKSTLISITTNGTLLSKDRARRFRAIGVDSIVISLDGSKAEANDLIRGEGTYDMVMSAIKTAKEFGFFVMIIHKIDNQSISFRLIKINKPNQIIKP